MVQGGKVSLVSVSTNLVLKQTFPNKPAIIYALIKYLCILKKDDQFIDFYSGTEVAINYLIIQLDSIGVFGIVQNDFNSGLLAGFVGGTPDTVRLKIKASDIEKSRPILEAFLNSNDHLSIEL